MVETIIFLKGITYFNNSLWQIIIAAFVFVLLIGVLMFFQSLVLRRLKKLAEKTTTEVDDVAVGIVASIRSPLYFIISLYIAYRLLNFSSAVDSVVTFAFFAIISFEIIRTFGKLVDYFGGLAIALAVQNILSDIFSSFSIFVDKPFQIGDFITVGADAGTVQKIGPKTTRIKTLQGEELIISNKELTSVRVQNFKRMERRRVVFKVGVVYGIDAKKLEKIPTLVKKIISSQKNIDFGRCHFKEYRDFSLNYEVVYFMNDKSYEEYMNVNEQINLDIYRAFEKEKIAFVYPTQTIFVEK